MSSPVVLDEWLGEQSARVDRALHELAAGLSGTRHDRALAYALESGGKRLRPALLLGAYEAVSRQAASAAIVRLACAVELIHTYSLIHDDLPCVDDDALRRGRPTLHRAFDVPAAMLAGAALIPWAFELLLSGSAEAGLDPEMTDRIVRELARSAGGGGMVGGQVLDLDAEGRAISLEDLEFLHRAKTGALISAAVRIGALAAHAQPEEQHALSTYARCVGLAFQIADDVLDETTGSAELGKTAGKDRTVRKATFPAMLGLQQASERARSEITEATTALRDAGIDSPGLEALAWFAIERRR